MRLYAREAEEFETYKRFKTLLEAQGFALLNRQPDESPDVSLYEDVASEEEVIGVIDDLKTDGISATDVSVYIFLGGRPEAANEWGFTPHTRAYFYIPTSVADNLDGWDSANDIDNEQDIEARQLREDMRKNLKDALDGYLRFYCKNTDALNGKTRMAKRMESKALAVMDADAVAVISEYCEIDVCVDQWMLAVYWPAVVPNRTWIIDILCEVDIPTWGVKGCKDQVMYYQAFIDDLVADGYEKTAFDLMLEDKMAGWLSSIQDDKNTADTEVDAA